MSGDSSSSQRIRQKLAAFDQLQPEFERCFSFVENMHGQKRLTNVSITDIVLYLHSLWICDCRTYLLSITRTVKTYNGIRCLELLKQWQEGGNAASVVAFLYTRLDAASMSSLTRQIELIRTDPLQRDQMQRLVQGRSILLNRSMNLLSLLDALFLLSYDELLRVVRETCRYYGHTPEQLSEQLELFSTPLYAYTPHQLLAQKNMQVMNKLGVQMQIYNIGKSRSYPARENVPANLAPPYAEEVIPNYRPFSNV